MDSPKYFIFWGSSPKLLFLKFRANFFKFEGSFLMPNPKCFIFSIFYPKSLTDKSNLKSYKFLGNFFIHYSKNFILLALLPIFVLEKSKWIIYRLLLRLFMLKSKYFKWFEFKKLFYKFNVKCFKWGRYMLPFLKEYIVSGSYWKKSNFKYCIFGVYCIHYPK